MATTARDVMQTGIVTVSPDAPLHAVQRLFIEEGIHGAPVVDQEGRVVGVITAMDILRAAAEDREVSPAEPAYFRSDLDLHGVDWSRVPDDLQERLADAVASDAMTSEIVSVSPDTSIPAVARALREHSVHRVLVIEKDALVGLVSAMDLVALLEGKR